jgi:hypothetical protein
MRTRQTSRSAIAVLENWTAEEEDQERDPMTARGGARFQGAPS